jgi:hypothetical protein
MYCARAVPRVAQAGGQVRLPERPVNRQVAKHVLLPDLRARLKENARQQLGELVEVLGPVQRRQHRDRGLRERARPAVGERRQQRVDDRGEVLRALAEERHGDALGAELPVEVLAEGPCGPPSPGRVTPTR